MITAATPKLVLCDFPGELGLPDWQAFSPFVLQVDRALKLARLPFTTRKQDLMKLKEVNPTGQLPVLLVDGEPVTDSTRIMHRIEQLRPGSLTGGLDARGIAEAWLWEEFADTALYPYVLTVRWADDRGWAVPREHIFGSMPAPLRAFVPSLVRKKTIAKLVGRDFLRGGLDACYERMFRVLDALDARAPESGFWLGGSACVADVGLFAQLHALRLPKIPWAAEEMAKRKKLSAWLDRVNEATRG